VFACDDDVCDAAEIDDVEVDGRTFLCPHPFVSFVKPREAVWPTAPGIAEYANSACELLKLYGSTEGS